MSHALVILKSLVSEISLLALWLFVFFSLYKTRANPKHKHSVKIIDLTVPEATLPTKRGLPSAKESCTPNAARANALGLPPCRRPFKHYRNDFNDE